MKRIYFLLILFISNVFFPINSVLAVGVEINTATLAELDEIVGIGSAIGQRIIDARPFSSLDDLLKVKGIGDKTLQKIKEQGLAYVSGGNQPVQQPPMPNSTEFSPPATVAPTLEVLPITYAEGIIISEFLPSPEGPDETDEWIKLYNKNTTEVNLGGWKIQDILGTITTYVFPGNTIIKGSGYLTLKRPQTNVVLNNQEDGLRLLQPNGSITDFANYTNAPKNQTYQKINDDWQWSGAVATTKPVTLAKNDSSALPEAQKTDNKYLSAISESLPNINQAINDSEKTKSSNPWFWFLGALAVIVILGVAVVILKFTLFKNHVRS